ncbi:MAG TPA: DUF222 domain-containing protein [Jatrophihabitans sp.]|nr:DUF222 domain-containing protein [Jatrophihabitans sp.]
MDEALAERVTSLAAAVDALLHDGLSAAGDDAVLAAARAVETARRRLETFDHVLVAELDRRSILARELAPSTDRFLAELWNSSPAEAKRRVRHARALGVRQSLTGEALPPLRPALAAAREAGAVNGEHAELILATLRGLPASLPVGTEAEAEEFLTGWARSVGPMALRGIAARLVATLDPDGRLTDTADHRRRRGLTLTPLADGMHRLTGDLDPACAALATTVLNALSAPRPTEAGGPDDRSPAQRRHDALASVCRLALRAGELPKTGGTPATVLITLTADQFRSGHGLAETTTGQQLSVADAIRLADQAELAVLFTDATGRLLTLHRSRRVASPGQTLALIGRDKGCTFPGCTMPPEWTEKHHVRAWRDGGATNIDNLCLVCDYHHDHHLQQGWTITMRDGLPYYRPPKWKDPEQRPIRNHHFQPYGSSTTSDADLDDPDG